MLGTETQRDSQTKTESSWQHWRGVGQQLPSQQIVRLISSRLDRSSQHFYRSKATWTHLWARMHGWLIGDRCYTTTLGKVCIFCSSGQHFSAGDCSGDCCRLKRKTNLLFLNEEQSPEQSPAQKWMHFALTEWQVLLLALLPDVQLLPNGPCICLILSFSFSPSNVI